MSESWAEIGRPDGPVEPWSRHPLGGLLVDRLEYEPATGSAEGLEQVVAWSKLAAFVQAGLLRAIGRLTGCQRRESLFGGDAEDLRRSVVAEVAMATGSSKTTAAGWYDDAQTLPSRLPGVFEALGEGRIDYRAARAIAEETFALTAEQLREAEPALLEHAEGRTAAQIRAHTKRVVARFDADALRRRTDKAARERCVRLDPEPNGMATLSAYLPAAQAVAAYGIINDFARRAGDDPADPRTMDARRADAFYDLITQLPADNREPEPDPATAHPDRRRQAHARARTEIRVTVPLSTLLGRNELPAELAGYGPIPAPIARELAADPNSTWRRLVTDPQSGALLDYGMTRYRPPPSMAGFLNARAVTCARPGCRMPAEHCDLDHHEPHDPHRQRGPTSEANMDPLCRPEHRLKQLPGWKIARNPDGTVTWTLPTGHTVTRHPPQIGETTHPEDPDEPPI